MASSAIVITKNTTCQDQPGHVDWTRYGAPDGEATADEHAEAILKFGAGWHTLRRLARGGLDGRDIFRLLRADFMRYAGDDCTGDPVYLLMF